MVISDFSIKKPIVTTVVMIAIVVFGMAVMLFQVRPYDPWTFATVAVVLTLTAVAAAATPAARAARVDPMVALRAD